MEVKFDIISIITFIGLFVMLFFISIMLTNKKGNFKANVIFSLLLISTSIVISDSGIILYSNLYYYIPHFAKIPTITQLLYGPLLLLYIKTLTRNEPLRAGSLVPHLIPFFIYIIIYSPILLQSGDDKILYVYSWVNDTVSKPVKIKESIFYAFILIQILSYLVYSKRYLNRYENDLKMIYSNIESDLTWIKNFIVLFIIIIIGSMFLYIPVLVFHLDFKVAYRFVPISSTIALCILAYRAAAQSDICFGLDISFLNKNGEPLLKNSEIKPVATKIIALMEQEKLYQQADLTLSDLSKKIGITRNQASYVINSYFKESFYDFVNRFRVEEVKKILTQTNNFNLLNIGLNVGFNSKTAFNVNFRKITKMSPSEYRRHHKNFE